MRLFSCDSAAQLAANCVWQLGAERVANREVLCLWEQGDTKTANSGAKLRKAERKNRDADIILSEFGNKEKHSSHCTLNSCLINLQDANVPLRRAFCNRWTNHDTLTAP